MDLEWLVCPQHGLLGVLLRQSVWLPMWRDLALTWLTGRRTA